VNQFFYDNQIRRFILQFIRILSNYQVEFGREEDGNRTLQRVPVRFAGTSRQAAAVLKENSASSMSSAPMISAYITGLTYDRPRIQEPNFVDKLQIREREYDVDSGTYTHRQGNAYTVERLMPVPYQLEVKADIWTSNTDQKLQILEQILPVFNPSLEIQSTDNYIDWTSLSYIELTGVQYTSLAMPIGLDDNIDLASLTFTMPIWLSAPARVKQLGVVQRIVSGVYQYRNEDLFDSNLLGLSRYTPLDYGILVLDGQVTLLKNKDSIIEERDSSGDTVIRKVGGVNDWTTLINLYGKLVNGVSQIRLFTEDGNMIVGTVSYHPTDESILLFNVDSDTIPANNLGPIDAIIDPTKVGPNSGLIAPAAGTRYLLTQAIGDDDNQDGADAWKGVDDQDLVADANDIIEYNGEEWVVVFDSATEPGPNYMTNIRTGLQYKWNGTAWSRSYEGRYRGGDWSLVL
jgi:hypothetical protein